jgi:D-sedoheptulose 7-phosphate isomerase
MMSYMTRLIAAIKATEADPMVNEFAADFFDCCKEKKQLFICGNGGSAGNAMHLANDFLYGITKSTGHGLRVNALTANSSVLTCLANDVGYENIFSEQLAVLANPGDSLLVLSGSGNSKNIRNVLLQAKKMGVVTYAILGYDGGECLSLADKVIHVAVRDMQIAEDMQMIVGHALMQTIFSRRSEIISL